MKYTQSVPRTRYSIVIDDRNAIKDHQLRREGCCSHLLNEIFQYIAIWNSFKLEIIYQYFKNITTQDKGYSIVIDEQKCH